MGHLIKWINSSVNSGDNSGVNTGLNAWVYAPCERTGRNGKVHAMFIRSKTTLHSVRESKYGV